LVATGDILHQNKITSQHFFLLDATKIVCNYEHSSEHLERTEHMENIMADTGFLRRECITEKLREEAEADYNERYERIANGMIAEVVGYGGSEHWQPQFRHVHAAVMAEIELEASF
jgi:hypothetical protein